MGKIFAQWPELVDYREHGGCDDGLSESLLHLAARGGHLDCIRTLIASGANVGVTDLYGNTPLHSAVHCTTCNCQPVLRLLLENGTDPHAMDDFGSTALEQARILCNDFAESVLRDAVGLAPHELIPPRLGERMEGAHVQRHTAAATIVDSMRSAPRSKLLVSDLESTFKPDELHYQSGTLVLQLSPSIKQRE